MLETTFVKVCDLNPLTYPKIDKARGVSKIIASVVQSTAIVSSVYYYTSRPLTDIRSFITLLALSTYVVSTPVNFFYIFHQDLGTVNFDILQDSEEAWAPVKETQSKFFCLVVGSVVMYCVSLVSLVSPWLLLYAFVAVGETFSMYQLASLKLMLSKRFRWIWDEVRKGENILSFLPAVRRLSDINERVNQMYSLKSSVVLSYHFGPYIMSLISFWEIYGLQHKHTSTWEERDPFLAMFSTFQIVFLLVFLGYSTNKYAEMIDVWVEEIDRAISTCDDPLIYRTQLHMIILELKQTPSELSALGLLTVDNPAVTAMFGFTITVMMVFIQFLK